MWFASSDRFSQANSYVRVLSGSCKSHKIPRMGRTSPVPPRSINLPYKGMGQGTHRYVWFHPTLFSVRGRRQDRRCHAYDGNQELRNRYTRCIVAFLRLLRSAVVGKRSFAGRAGARKRGWEEEEIHSPGNPDKERR